MGTQELRRGCADTSIRDSVRRKSFMCLAAISMKKRERRRPGDMYRHLPLPMSHPETRGQRVTPTTGEYVEQLLLEAGMRAHRLIRGAPRFRFHARVPSHRFIEIGNNYLFEIPGFLGFRWAWLRVYRVCNC